MRGQGASLQRAILVVLDGVEDDGETRPLAPHADAERRLDPHEAAGVALAKQVQPLDADGKPNGDGKIVMLSVGMSNTSQSSDGFRRQLQGEKEKNPQVVFVNGAQGGMTAQHRGGGGREHRAAVDAALAGHETEVRRIAWEAYRAAPIHAAARKDFERHRVRYQQHVSPYAVKKVGRRPEKGWPLLSEEDWTSAAQPNRDCN